MSELDDLRSATRDLLEDKAPVRSNTEDNPAIWKQLAVEMGLAALATEAPLSWTAAVAEETGRVLLRAPFVSTAVAAAVTKEPGLADGSLTAAVQTGDTVAWAATADMLLDLRGPEGLLVRDFTATPVDALDLTQPSATVTHNGGAAVGSSTDALDLLHVLTAAESVGAAQRVLELVVEHLLVRTQFGRPLGSFQALRHKVADLTVLVEAARSTTWYAASQPEDFTVVAPLARALASEALVTVTGESIQLFGGIGFTWEHDAHLYFKRAWTTALAADSKQLKAMAFERSGA